MKSAGNFLVTSTSHLASLMDRVIFQIGVLGFRFVKAAPKSCCASHCNWQRVAREGWKDHALALLGWYPWQCKKCLDCSHFRRRYY